MVAQSNAKAVIVMAEYDALDHRCYAAGVFVFFSNRFGCLGSIAVLIVTAFGPMTGCANLLAF